MPAELKVSEVFRSVQGEGPSVGTPCVFLRLAGCNLACGYCDTRYSWDWQQYDPKREVRRESVDALVARLGGATRLVITGGEPLLQQSALVPLIASLPASLMIEVETNGTLQPRPELCARIDQWNVSPKLSNSGEPLHRRIRREALEALRDTQRAWLKCVVQSPGDVLEVERLVGDLGWLEERVQLMPQATTRAQLEQALPQVAAWTMQTGYRLSNRLHLQLFDGARGR